MSLQPGDTGCSCCCCPRRNRCLGLRGAGRLPGLLRGPSYSGVHHSRSRIDERRSLQLLYQPPCISASQGLPHFERSTGPIVRLVSTLRFSSPRGGGGVEDHCNWQATSWDCMGSFISPKSVHAPQRRLLKVRWLKNHSTKVGRPAAPVHSRNSVGPPDAPLQKIVADRKSDVAWHRFLSGVDKKRMYCGPFSFCVGYISLAFKTGLLYRKRTSCPVISVGLQIESVLYLICSPSIKPFATTSIRTSEFRIPAN
jgi:hypothetical protein